MKELIDLTFNEMVEIGDITTGGYITSDMSFGVVEVINTSTDRKLEYNIYGEKKWLYPEKPVRLYMTYKDYVNLLASQYGISMLEYFNSIAPVQECDTTDGKYIYLSELYDEHKQILEQYNCIIDYYNTKDTIKRYFEIIIVDGKWYLYHGQYDESGNIMLFIILNEQGVKDYCIINNINYK